MEETEIAQIVQELRRRHPERAGQQDLSDFELTLAVLPERSVWRVADLKPAVFALAPGDRLFTITLEDPPEPGLPCPATLLLARIGSTAAPGEPSAPRDLSVLAAQEPSAPEPPAPSESSRRQVTDIWGNPLPKGSRRRR